MQRIFEAELSSLNKLNEAIEAIRQKTYYAWTHGQPAPVMELWQDCEPSVLPDPKGIKNEPAQVSL